MLTIATLPKFVDVAARVMSRPPNTDLRALVRDMSFSKGQVSMLDLDGGRHELRLPEEVFRSFMREKLGFPPNAFFNEQLEDSTRTAVMDNLIESNGDNEVFLRCSENELDAILSSSYARINNFDICHQLVLMQGDGSLPVDLRAESFNLSPNGREMHMRLVSPDWKFKIGDDPFYGAVVISNNEIGDGSFDVSSAIQRQACENMAIGEKLVNVTHRWDKKEHFVEALRNGMMGVLGAIETMRSSMNEMRDVPLAYPRDMLDKLILELKLPKTAADQATEYLAEQTDNRTMYDVVQAVTFASQSVSIPVGRGKQNWMRRSAIERNIWAFAELVRSGHADGKAPEDFYVGGELKLMDRIAAYLREKSAQYEGQAHEALVEVADEILTM